MTDLIDKIEIIRSHNNRTWMTILRVALDADPVGVKYLIQEIIKHDRQVIETMRDSVPTIKGPIPRFNTIGIDERRAADLALRGTLSGFLGGELRGGHHIRRLEETWAEMFGVKHAIATNSATSGLLLACMAAGVRPYTKVLTTPYTMSATVAAPRFLGASIHFEDIEAQTFCLDHPALQDDDGWHEVVIVTNLFGHPAELVRWREHCDKFGTVLIEDNAQAIFAKEGNRYAGTIGHIGVFSLNVHKHLQCGEGGVCVTNDDSMADRIRLGLNHGELSGRRVGLNLRMTEVTAAIALEQLYKADKIMSERREIAEAIIDAAKPLLAPPVVREGCTHSYYMIPWLTETPACFAAALQDEGVPVRKGYTTPLYDLPAFKGSSLPITEYVEKEEIIVYENCAWTPTSEQLKQFKEAFNKVGDRYVVSQRDAGTDSGDGREVAGLKVGEGEGKVA